MLLAKQLASLDQVSDGRLDVGVGLGWSEDEYDAVNVPFRQRGKRGDEFLRCLKEIWTKDEVEFTGEFYRVPRAKVEPKPVQKPHPPITVGGYSPVVVRGAVTLGDGFNGGNVPLDRVAPVVKELRDEAVKIGRDPATLHVVSRGSTHVFDRSQEPEHRPLWVPRRDPGRHRALRGRRPHRAGPRAELPARPAGHRPGARPQGGAGAPLTRRSLRDALRSGSIAHRSRHVAPGI